MKKQGYKFGVEWIAVNDSPNDGDDLEAVATYVSTLLLADLFGKEASKVAADILRYRQKNKIGQPAGK